MKSLILITIFFSLISTQAKVYKNIKAGEYNAVVDLREYAGQPFFQVMKNIIYPMINSEAANATPWYNGHIEAIESGEGVEVILGDDVTTYHVKYLADTEDKVERSGRSFGAVGATNLKTYIADASYKHYLRSLEYALKGDDEKAEAFFRAIVRFMTHSDPTGIAALEERSKKVASDFVAIYIAEQYRRLTATKGESLGRRHRWDDALVQVTLLAAFHSGQEQMEMYYEGEFTSEVYHQSACLYRADKESEDRLKADKRQSRLYDYWQFTVRSECPGRSGVNLTRRDFQKLGKALTKKLQGHDFGTMMIYKPENKYYKSNFFSAATHELLKGDFEDNADEFSEVIVETLMTIRLYANEMSAEL